LECWLEFWAGFCAPLEGVINSGRVRDIMTISLLRGYELLCRSIWLGARVYNRSCTRLPKQQSGCCNIR
jgi:hypothetical protein